MNKQKKQTIVLGALVAVIAAVGAFQFMGAKPKPVVEDTKSEAKKDETLIAANTKPVDPTQVVIDELIASATTPRDPFQPQAVLIDNVEQEGENQGTQVGPHKTNPGGFQQEIQGNVGQGGFTGNTGGGTTGGTTVEPLDPNVPDSFNGGTGRPFTLRGVMIGRSKKLCMIEFADGRQALISEGQSFGRDNESIIVSITDQEVVLRHRGQEQTLPLHGGN